MSRLLDIAAAISVGTDLGNGRPPETAMRITRRALRLAAKCSERVEPTVLLWSGLLRFAGCVSTSVEEASFGGDDLALRSALLFADLSDPGDLVRRLGSGDYVPAGSGPIDLPAFAERGPQLAPGVLAAHCEVAVSLATRLGLQGEELRTIATYHERFDGRGPLGLAGGLVPLGSRILAVAQAAELHREHAAGERRAVLRARANHWYDPHVVEIALADDAPLEDSPWSELEAAQGRTPRAFDEEQLPELLRALGDWADLKSPWFAGHARAVARTAATVARAEGEDAALLSAAATVHDVGRVGVPNGVWDHPGVLDAAQTARAQTHVGIASTILSRIPGLEAVRRLVAVHHERPDGSGYPSALDGGSLSRAARLLAAADVWVSLGQPRPYRPAFSKDGAARVLREEVAAGRLDARAVASVLDGAGFAYAPEPLPNGLSAREVEVLGLVARGLTNKQVGAELGLSARTVQQHTLRIYRKIGVTTRAAAALFAAQQDLLG
jgi:HD-GYP domain-containing protein (c-di-GMP phosphodiesterase class II)/DNA-binding CsgD family transcriptional regulator